MTEPAKVYKVQNDISSVDYPEFNDRTNTFITHRSNLQSFGKNISVSHGDYHDMAKDILDRDYSIFIKEMEDNCKVLFVTDPVYSHNYDTMTHTDKIGWSVRVGSPQLDYFKELYKCQLTHYNDLEVRWMETKVPVEPTTLRECFKQAWRIIRKRFSRER